MACGPLHKVLIIAQPQMPSRTARTCSGWTPAYPYMFPGFSRLLLLLPDFDLAELLPSERLSGTPSSSCRLLPDLLAREEGSKGSVRSDLLLFRCERLLDSLESLLERHHNKKCLNKPSRSTTIHTQPPTIQAAVACCPNMSS